MLVTVFSPFSPNVFYPIKDRMTSISATNNLLSANAFKSVESRMLCLGTDLNGLLKKSIFLYFNVSVQCIDQGRKKSIFQEKWN